MGSDGEVPRLLPAVQRERPEQLYLDWTATVERIHKLANLRWEEYDEPTLLSVVGFRRAVIVSRVAVALVAIALVVAAIGSRSNALDGSSDGSAVSTIGLIGIVLRTKPGTPVIRRPARSHQLPGGVAVVDLGRLVHSALVR